MTTPSTLILGVDPDTTRPGVAVWDTAERAFVSVGTMELRELLAWARQGCPPGIALAVVEDSRSLPIYDRHVRTATDMFNTLREKGFAVPPSLSKTLRYFAVQAVHVGEVKAVTTFIIDTLAEAGVEVRTQAPASGGKLDADAFRQRTGWRGRTNGEARDAAMLVHDKWAGELWRMKQARVQRGGAA